MAYDPAAGNVVLFGGQDNTGAYLNDTWIWDGTDWIQQFPLVSPSPRDTYMAIDEATNNVVLFGGNNGGEYLNDTWTWDGVAKTWTKQNPPASPSARISALTYDRATHTVVLFGGAYASNAAYGDTWTWNGVTWVQQFPTSAPSARSSNGLVYDPSLGSVVLFGGAVGGLWQQSTNDTWIWDGTNWKQINPATVPTNRYAFGIDYDVEAKAVVVFGGYSTGPARGDTWLLRLTQ
jgi:hypothetical protein